MGSTSSISESDSSNNSSNSTDSCKMEINVGDLCINLDPKSLDSYKMMYFLEVNESSAVIRGEKYYEDLYVLIEYDDEVKITYKLNIEKIKCISKMKIDPGISLYSFIDSMRKYNGTRDGFVRVMKEKLNVP